MFASLHTQRIVAAPPPAAKRGGQKASGSGEGEYGSVLSQFVSKAKEPKEVTVGSKGECACVLGVISAWFPGFFIRECLVHTVCICATFVSRPWMCGTPEILGCTSQFKFSMDNLHMHRQCVPCRLSVHEKESLRTRLPFMHIIIWCNVQVIHVTVS